jgi:hypothetical protein
LYKSVWERGERPGSEELQRNQQLGLADNETRNAYYAHPHRDLDLASVRDWDRRANERLLVALAELPESRLQEPDWWTYGRALGSVFDVDHDRGACPGYPAMAGAKLIELSNLMTIP